MTELRPMSARFVFTDTHGKTVGAASADDLVAAVDNAALKTAGGLVAVYSDDRADLELAINAFVGRGVRWASHRPADGGA